MEGHLEQVDTLNARQFYIAIRKLADTLSYGTDSSRFLGSGIEYVQSRPYQHGDPVRSIDWRVTARTGVVHVKEYEAPKRLPCYLLIDTSASMTISSVARSKYAVALHLAGGIALACLDRVSPVGVIGVGSREFRIEPSLSRQRILQWLLHLRRFRYDETTRIGARVAELSPSLTNRALVIVFSDLHDAEAIGPLKLLAQRHEVIVLLLEDPAERGVRGAGILRAGEAETGKAFVSRARRSWIDTTDTEAALRRAGIDRLSIRTDQPFAHRVRSFFKARDLFGKGVR